VFTKATKERAKLRLAIAGASGSGKTYTALTIGRHIGKRMALIDTERGSASKYAGDVADFDACNLDVFSVPKYLQAIKFASEAGYDVLIVDSLSHAWAGKGGILEEADKRGGKFQAWKQLTPIQQSLMDAILSYPGHIICTMRSKMAYELSTDDSQGRKETKVEKLGLAPVQRDDVSYEFDVMLDMDERNNARVTKTRCKALQGQVIERPGQELAETLLAWLSDGAEPRPPSNASASTRQSAPASSPQSAAGSRARQTSTPRSSDTTRSAPSSTDRELPADAAGWLAAHNAVCDQLFEQLGIAPGAADEYGLYAATLPCPSFSDTAKQHAGERYDAVPVGYLREVLWKKPKFWAEAGGPQRQHVSYLVCRHELEKLEAAAAEAALSASAAAQQPPNEPAASAAASTEENQPT
jgi:hypothetical protein